MLSQLEKLVRLESPTEDLEACRAVIKLASDIAREVLGSPAAIREVNGRPVFWWGAEKPDVVVLAHLDTVWPKGSFQPLWSIKDNAATGPGIFDMKAGFIQALFAMKGIDGSAALIATSDEETGSATSKEFIKEISAQAKAVLVLEASLDGKVKTGRKGTSMYQVKIHGKASHAGLEPEKGVNATVEIAHAMDELQRVDAAVRNLKAVNPQARYEITGGFNRPPLETTSTLALYERAERVAKSLGMPALGHASVGGASDGNFAAAAGAQVLDGLGAVGHGAHAAHEWVDITTLESRSALLHALIKDILND